MSNRRRPKRPKADERAGASLALLLSARRDGCICTAPVATLRDLTGDYIVGDVTHFDPSCPLWAGGFAAPHRVSDLAQDLPKGNDGRAEP